MRKNRNQEDALATEVQPGEANIYDKILKECWRETTPEILTKFMGVPEGRFRPVHIEFQRTRERRTDFIGEWQTEGMPKTILHFEIHGKNEKRFASRQMDTAGLINWHYPSPKWDLIQIAFYIGKTRPSIPTEIQKRDFTYRFRLFWVKDFNYREFLETGRLEFFLLAALANYDGKSPEEVFVEVVNAARKVAKSDLDFERFTEQLHVLSNIHNLQQIFSKVMVNVSKLIKEEKDPFFKRGEKIGFEKGIEKGIEKGKLEGRLEGKLEGISEMMLEVMVNLMTKSDHDDSFIASITGAESETVRDVREIVSKHPTDFQERLKNIKLKIKPSQNGGSKTNN